MSDLPLRVESGVQPCVLPRELHVAFVDLVREENRLGLAVRAERDRLCCRALTPEPSKDAGEPLSHLGQRVHLDHRRTGHSNSVLKLVQRRLGSRRSARP
jgi:hypothetical protein